MVFIAGKARLLIVFALLVVVTVTAVLLASAATGALVYAAPEVPAAAFATVVLLVRLIQDRVAGHTANTFANFLLAVVA